MLARLRHWLKQTGSEPAPGVFFQVACACGRVITGPRLPAPQVRPCPACAAYVFVLPLSPWLEEARKQNPQLMLPQAKKLRRRDLLLPVTASGLAILVLFLVYRFLVGPLLENKKDHGLSTEPASKIAVLERLAQARKFLAEGSFRLAADGMAKDSQKLDLLAPEGRRYWRQVERQAALLADLLAEPLEDLVRHAAGTRSQDEWQADFRHRYQGKAVVLDAEFRKPFGAPWQVNYPLIVAGQRVKVVVDEVKILQRLPPNEPVRLVVGLRLASLKLEPPGPTWVLRFDPDGGVFLTDPDAAARVCPALAEEDTKVILKRQEGWAE